MGGEQSGHVDSDAETENFSKNCFAEDRFCNVFIILVDWLSNELWPHIILAHTLVFVVSLMFLSKERKKCNHIRPTPAPSYGNN